MGCGQLTAEARRYREAVVRRGLVTCHESAEGRQVVGEVAHRSAWRKAVDRLEVGRVARPRPRLNRPPHSAWVVSACSASATGWRVGAGITAVPSSGPVAPQLAISVNASNPRCCVIHTESTQASTARWYSAARSPRVSPQPPLLPITTPMRNFPPYRLGPRWPTACHCHLARLAIATSRIVSSWRAAQRLRYVDDHQLASDAYTSSPSRHPH